VNTNLDISVFKCKSGGTSWPHRLDVVIIKVHVHIVVIVLHAVLKFGLMGEDSQKHCVLAMQLLFNSLAATVGGSPKQRSELTLLVQSLCTRGSAS
jgi:hypothetical protein